MTVGELKKALEGYEDDDVVLVHVMYSLSSKPDCVGSVVELIDTCRNGDVCQLNTDLGQSFSDILEITYH